MLLSVCLSVSLDILYNKYWHVLITSALAPLFSCKLQDLPWIWFHQELRIFIFLCYFPTRIHPKTGSPLWLVDWCCQLRIFPPPLCCYFIHFYVIFLVLDNLLWALGLCFQNITFTFFVLSIKLLYDGINRSSYYMMHKPNKVIKRVHLRPLTEPNPLLFVSHTLLLPDTEAHSGRVSPTETVMPIQKAVGRTRCDHVLTGKLQVCESAVTMQIAMLLATFFHPL